MRRLTTVERIELIEQFKKSGNTLSSFAESKSISKGTLSYWLKKEKEPVKKSMEPTARFVPIEVEDDSLGVIRVVKENITIEFSKQVSPEYIKSILGW
ncbi:MAG: hypothetical protein RLZZ546_1595 [Bacteroidota bacterium]|jgi:transposase-like protein